MQPSTRKVIPIVHITDRIINLAKMLNRIARFFSLDNSVQQDSKRLKKSEMTRFELVTRIFMSIVNEVVIKTPKSPFISIYNTYM